MDTREWLNPGTDVIFKTQGPKNTATADILQQISHTFSGPSASMLSGAVERLVFVLAQLGGGMNYDVEVKVQIRDWDDSELNIKISRAEVAEVAQ